MKILICSVEEGTREALKLILADQYELIITDSFDKCLETVKGNNTLTAIIDIDKQENIANKFDSLNHFNGLNIIALGNVKSKETLRGLSCKKYVLKPIKSDELLESLKD